MDVSDARKVKALEDKSAKLKRLLAEQMLDDAMLARIVLRMTPGRLSMARVVPDQKIGENGSEPI